MGLKKIAELRKVLDAKQKTFEEFRRAADEFNKAYVKIAAAYDGVAKLRSENLARIERLETHNIKEFEDYRKALVAVYEGWGNRPLPLKPLEVVIEKQKEALEAEKQKLVDKLVATMPAEVKPGMVFKLLRSGELCEITSDKSEATNVNLKGDERLWYDYKTEGGRTGKTNLKDLKTSYKFVKI